MPIRVSANRLFDFSIFSSSTSIPRLLAGSCIALGLLGAASPAALAQTAATYPVMEIGEATLASPSDAWTNHYSGLGTTHTDHTLTQGGDRDIDELARALRNDVDIIYEHIRDNVEMVWTFGLTKGARGAAIDGYGTSFDQAHLFVEMLRTSGYTADYKYGTITLTGAEFSAWSGIDTAAEVDDFLSDGGFPASVDGSGNVTLAHIWVEVTIDSTPYLFDPSYKPHTEIAGLANLETAMGYNGSTFLSNAQSTLVTGTDSLRNVNASGIRSNLTTYATNLIDYLEDATTGIPGAHLEDVIGGSTIDSYGGAELRQSTFTYTTSTTTSWTGDIPNAFRTAVTVDLPVWSGQTQPSGAIDTITLYGDEIYAKRFILRQAAASPYRLSLMLDGVEVAWTHQDTNNDTDPTHTAPIGISVDHPYAADSGAYMDTSMVRNVDVIMPAAIIVGFGTTERGLFNLMASEMDADRERIYTPSDCGGSCTPYPISEYDRSKVLMGADYLTQASRIADIYDRLAEGRSQHHHTIGFVSSLVHMDGQDIDGQAIRVDLDSAYSVLNDASSTDLRAGQRRALAASLGALEGSIVHQILDTVHTVSVPSKFDWMNTNETAANFYEVTATNWSTVSSLLFLDIDTSVRTAHLDILEDYVVTNGYTALVPALGELGPSDSYGSGTVSTNLEDGAAFIAYMPDDTAFANVIIRYQAEQDTGGGADARVYPVVRTQPSANELAMMYMASSESEAGVAQAGGASVYSSGSDISSGMQGFPYGLSFARAYRAGGPTSEGMGDGWTHNYDARVFVSSSGIEALGHSSGRRAAGSIAALYATLDVMSGTISSDERILPSFIMDWWADELEHNLYTLTAGAGGEHIMELADGTIDPALASLTRLTVTGSVATIVESGRTRWNYSGLSFDMLTPSGVLNEFSYWSRDEFGGASEILNQGFHLDAVKFPFGVNVALTYDTEERLDNVNNGLNRELDFWFRRPSGDGSIIDTSTYGFAGLVNPEAALHRVRDASPGISGRHTKFYYAFVGTGSPSGLGFSSRNMVLNTVSGMENADQAYFYEGPHFDLDGSFYASYTNGDAFPTTHSLLSAAQEAGDQEPSRFMHLSARGRVFEVENIFGNTTQMHLAPRRTEIVNALGDASISYTNRRGQTSRSINALGHAVAFQQDNFGRVTQVNYPEGNCATFEYDASHNLITSSAYPIPTSPDVCEEQTGPIEASATYGAVSGLYGDILNRPSSMTNANGDTSSYDYYSTTGLLDEIALPLAPVEGQSNQSPVTSVTYNTIGQVLEMQDAEGLISLRGYTDNDLTSVAVDPSGENLLTTIDRDDNGRVEKVTQPEGNFIEYGVTSEAGWTTRNYGEADRSTRRSFDDRGNVDVIEHQQLVDSQLTWITVRQNYYDIGGRLTSVDRQGSITSYAYDELGRRVQITNPEGEVTAIEFDELGRTYRTLRAAGTSQEIVSATYAYGISGQLDSVTDAEGNITNYEYDDHLRLFRTTFEDMTYEQYLYTDAGQMASRLTRDGDLIQYAYDALGRAATKTVPGLPTISYFYDLTGRQTSVTNTSGEDWDYAYDDIGRLTSVTEVHESNRAVSYQYDDNSRRTRQTWPDAYYVDYAYNLDNQVTTITDSSSTPVDLASYAYDIRGRLETITYGNGTSTDFVRADNNELETLTHNFAGAASVEFDYGYDMAHRMVSELIDDASFEWDQTGFGTDTYIANDLNQYSEINTILHYSDSNGNLTYDGANTYTYDAENRLTQADMDSGAFQDVVDYEYDPFGRLRQRTVTVPSSSQYRTEFLSSGADFIAEYDEVISTGVQTLQYRYIYGPGTDNPIVMVDETGSTPARSYYHQDRRGSVIALTDDSGAVTDSYSYDAFGNPDSWTGNRIRYTGRWMDHETGLYYYRARFYSPGLGRFLQTDPIGYGDGMNMYAYVGSDPVNRTDPSGLKAGGLSGSRFDDYLRDLGAGGGFGFQDDDDEPETFIVTGIDECGVYCDVRSADYLDNLRLPGGSLDGTWGIVGGEPPESFTVWGTRPDCGFSCKILKSLEDLGNSVTQFLSENSCALVQFGNDANEIAYVLAEISLGGQLIGAGLVGTGIAAPEGAALFGVSTVGGITAGFIQTIGGVSQGLGGAGWGNVIAGTANLATGSLAGAGVRALRIGTRNAVAVQAGTTGFVIDLGMLGAPRHAAQACS